MDEKQLEKFVEEQLITLTTEILYHQRAAAEALILRDSHVAAFGEASKQREHILRQFPGRGWTLGLVERKDEKALATPEPSNGVQGDSNG